MLAPNFFLGPAVTPLALSIQNRHWCYPVKNVMKEISIFLDEEGVKFSS